MMNFIFCKILVTMLEIPKDEFVGGGGRRGS